MTDSHFANQFGGRGPRVARQKQDRLGRIANARQSPPRWLLTARQAGRIIASMLCLESPTLSRSFRAPAPCLGLFSPASDLHGPSMTFSKHRAVQEIEDA